jgi:hypothetical protein
MRRSVGSKTHIWVARIVRVSSPKGTPSQQEPRRLIRELEKLKDLRGNSTLSEKRISVWQTLYTARWKPSMWSIQLLSGFHLGKIWATNLRSPASPSELRLASHPSR